MRIGKIINLICRTKRKVKLLNLSREESLEVIKEVHVKYLDKSVKMFNVHEWLNFREGIFKNLYNVNKCRIKVVKNENSTNI